MTLYHGTSERRLRQILEMDCIRATGVKSAVSFSTRFKPAHYWANMAASEDRSEPVVLKMSGILLLEAQYKLIPFSDPVWGEGKCDWEYEVQIKEDVYPLSDFLKSYETVSWSELRNKCPQNILIWANKLTYLKKTAKMVM